MPATPASQAQAHLMGGGPNVDPLLGSMVGSYRLTRLLGEGGMARVYLGEHPAIGSRVAIKFIHESLGGNVDLIERFFAEARAVNLVGHENIVSIHDLNRLPPNRYFIVMEYLEGETLAEWVARGPQPLEKVLPVLLQLCDALQSAHARGIIHRDLKPDNVFVIRRGRRDDFVKLVDFGIAKLRTEGHETRTSVGTLIGTPEYMAPEQCDARPVDGRTDQYALALIAYQLVTGRLPFQSSSVPQLLIAHLTAPAPDPRTFVPTLPPEWCQVLLRALSKRPDERHADMEAFALALDEAAQAHLRRRGWAPAPGSGSFAPPPSGSFAPPPSGSFAPPPSGSFAPPSPGAFGQPSGTFAWGGPSANASPGPANAIPVGGFAPANASPGPAHAIPAPFAPAHASPGPAHAIPAPFAPAHASPGPAHAIPAPFGPGSPGPAHAGSPYGAQHYASPGPANAIAPPAWGGPSPAVGRAPSPPPIAAPPIEPARPAPKAKPRLPVEVIVAGLVRGPWICTDLTKGGCFVETTEAAPAMLSRVQLRFVRASGETPALFTAEVVRHVTAAEAQAWRMTAGFALQFSGIDASARATLEWLLGDGPAPAHASAPAADGPARLLLAAYEHRKGGPYELLELPPTVSFEDARRKGRQAAEAARRVQQQGPSPELAQKLAWLIAELDDAGAALSDPKRRLEVDLARPNLRGVQLCIDAMIPHEVARRRRELLARSPTAEAAARAHLVRAVQAEARKDLKAALSAYDDALKLDPLNADAHKRAERLRATLPTKGSH